MSDKWLNLFGKFFAFKESLKCILLGFMPLYSIKFSLYNGNFDPSFLSFVRISLIFFISLIIVWLIIRLVVVNFELLIYNSYKKDYSNYSEGGIVYNTKTKKLEADNYLISISERLSSFPKCYPYEVQYSIKLLKYVSFCFGLILFGALPSLNLKNLTILIQNFFI